MTYLLAFLPILVVGGLMLGLRWGGQQAGPLAWLVTLVVALTAFGATWDVVWVSQLKGLLLSAYVLLVIWPALFIYALVDGIGGMNALEAEIKLIFPDR